MVPQIVFILKVNIEGQMPHWISTHASSFINQREFMTVFESVCKSFSTSPTTCHWPTFLSSSHLPLSPNIQYYLYCCLLAMLGVIVFVRTCMSVKALLLTLAVVVYLALFLHVYAPRSYCLIDLLYNDTK